MNISAQTLAVAVASNGATLRIIIESLCNADTDPKREAATIMLRSLMEVSEGQAQLQPFEIYKGAASCVQ